MSKEKRTIEIAPRLKVAGTRVAIAKVTAIFGRRTAIGNVTSRNAPCVKAAEDLMLW